MRSVALILGLVLLLSACSGSEAAAPSPIPDELNFSSDDGLLRLAMVQPKTTLPKELVLTDQGQVILSDLLYDGLTQVDTATGDLQPGLATAWTANGDLTEWTFQIDTPRISAAEVVASFEKPERHSSSAIRNQLSVIESSEVLNESEVVFNLEHGSASFPWLLSGPAMAVDGYGSKRTGGFQVLNEDASGMTLRSQVDTPDIEIWWTANESEAEQLLASGDVDLAVGSSQEDSTDLLGHVRFLAINTNSLKLVDPAVRSGVYAELISATAEVGVPPVSFSSIDGVSSPALAGSQASACKASCPEVPESVEFGSRNLRLRLGVTSESEAQLAEDIVQRIEAPNLSIEVSQSSARELAQGVAAGEVDILMFGWIAGSASIDASIPPLFGSGSAANIFQMSDPEVDRLLAEADVTSDDTLRWELLAEAEAVALSSHVAVPLGAMQSKVLKGERAQDLVVRADGSLDIFRY